MRLPVAAETDARLERHRCSATRPTCPPLDSAGVFADVQTRPEMCESNAMEASSGGTSRSARRGTEGERLSLVAERGVSASRTAENPASGPPSASESPSKRKRAKPPAPAWLRPFIDQARQRHEKRPPSPGLVVEPAQNGSYRLEPPHRDFEAWEVQICDAFGTRSYSTYCFFLDQLAALCTAIRDENGDWRPSEQELNAALNIVSGVRPRNEMEAALAAQMVAVHFMTMKLAGQALGRSWIDPRTAAVTGKLARTFAMQCDTLNRMRGRVGRQTIKVRYERHDHRHLHVEEGGLKKGTQAHATARRTDRDSRREPQRIAALRSKD
jgi:hypothetical protein